MSRPKSSQISLGQIKIHRGRLWQTAIGLLSKRPLDFEEESRRLLFGGLCLLAIVTLTSFGIRNLLNNSTLEAIFDFLIAGFCVYSLVALRSKTGGMLYYRIGVAMLGVLFIFLGTLGAEHGHRALSLIHI